MTTSERVRGLTVGQELLVAVGIVVTGVAVAIAPSDPRLFAGLVVVAGGVFCTRYVEVAAAGLAFVIAGHFSSVATNVHGLPSPSVGLAAAIVLGILLRPDTRSFVPPPRLVLLFAGYGLVVIASVLWAAHPDRTFEAADVLARDMVFGILVASVARRMDSLRLTLWAIMAAIGLLAAVSVVQFFTGNFTSSYGGLSEAVVANIVIGTDDWRIVGPFGDPNYYAQMLAIGIAVGLNRALHERRRSLRVLAATTVVVSTLAMYTTFSRGGAFTLGVLIVAFLLLRRPRPYTVGLTLLAVLLIVPILPAEFRDRISATVDLGSGSAAAPADIAVRGRLSEALAGAAMFRDAPLLGVGVANYPPTYQEYAQEFQLDLRPQERSAHSLYVEIASESGVLGITAFGALLVGVLGALRRRSRWDRDIAPPARALTEGLGLALLAFLTSSVFLHGAHDRIFWLLTGLALALPLDRLQRDAPPDDIADDALSPTRHPVAPASTR